MKVKIPFQEEFRDRMLDGKKTCTSRTKRYGEVGDTFEAFGAELRIAITHKHPLYNVADILYEQEGFDTPEEFKACWIKLHPRRGFDPEQKVWVHFFRRTDA